MIAARLMQAFGLFLVQGQSQEGGGRQTPFALESPDGGHGGDYILFRQASVEDNQGGRGVGIQGRRFFRVAGLPYFLPLIFEKNASICRVKGRDAARITRRGLGAPPSRRPPTAMGARAAESDRRRPEPRTPG